MTSNSQTARSLRLIEANHWTISIVKFGCSISMVQTKTGIGFTDSLISFDAMISLDKHVF